MASVGYMRRDAVEVRKWISPEDYKVGLTLAQLAGLACGAARDLTWGSSTSAFAEPRLPG